MMVLACVFSVNVHNVFRPFNVFVRCVCVLMFTVDMCLVLCVFFCEQMLHVFLCVLTE